ncbi:MAG: prepilin-type N-terminal cleavage/methylation domain-containing protein [Planctomycetota bacterium]
MKRTAFTLIEVLLCLVLLGTLTIATVSWTTRVLELQKQQQASATSEREMDLFRRTLQIDLMNDDIHLSALAGREHRVWLSGQSLHVLCRDAGAVQAVYTPDSEGHLNRTVHPIDEGRPRRSDPVAFDTHNLRWELERRDKRSFGSITARWNDAHGMNHQLRIDVPREWLP